MPICWQNNLVWNVLGHHCKCTQMRIVYTFPIALVHLVILLFLRTACISSSQSTQLRHRKSRDTTRDQYTQTPRHFTRFHGSSALFLPPECHATLSLQGKLVNATHTQRAESDRAIQGVSTLLLTPGTHRGREARSNILINKPWQVPTNDSCTSLTSTNHTLSSPSRDLNVFLGSICSPSSRSSSTGYCPFYLQGGQLFGVTHLVALSPLLVTNRR